MTTATASPLLGAQDPGATLRRAGEIFDRHAIGIAAALRRAIPFLARRALPITATPAESASLAAILRDATTPSYAVHLASDPGGLRALLLIDATAIAFLLDGVLGGDGTNPPALEQRLTPAQSALVGRFGESMVQAISSVLERASTRLTKLPVASEGSETPALVVRFDIGEGAIFGSISLAIARDTLLGTAAGQPRGGDLDPRVGLALEQVELELVAELGRLRMRLADVLSLKVGDVLKLHVPLDGNVQVRAEGNLLFEGHPTTSGAQVAIRITSSVK